MSHLSIDASGFNVWKSSNSLYWEEKKKEFDAKNAKKTLDNKKIINFSQTEKEKRTKAVNYQYHKSENGYDHRFHRHKT